MLRGIMPILFVPFDAEGQVDEAALRRILRFELEGGVHGIGINGFASEAYKLSEAERLRTAEIVAHEIGGKVPLILGIAPGSTEAAIAQAKALEYLHPAALMMLPPSTFDNGPKALVQHYVDVSWATQIPIMVQQSPHIPQYAHCSLSSEYLAEMAEGAEGICYFKIEGPGAPERIAALRPLVGETVGLFGGVGGITFLNELEAGASGVIPGVGFNEVFLQAWAAWTVGNKDEVRRLLEHYNPLVQAVSGKGHEFSIHARKHLMRRAGYLENAYVRRPTVEIKEGDLEAVAKTADQFGLRISRTS